MFQFQIGIQKDAIIIKKGFPPKPIATNEENLVKSIAELGIKNKDTLIIEVDTCVVQTVLKQE